LLHRDIEIPGREGDDNATDVSSNASVQQVISQLHVKIVVWSYLVPYNSIKPQIEADELDVNDFEAQVCSFDFFSRLCC